MGLLGGCAVAYPPYFFSQVLSKPRSVRFGNCNSLQSDQIPPTSPFSGKRVCETLKGGLDASPFEKGGSRGICYRSRVDKRQRIHHLWLLGARGQVLQSSIGLLFPFTAPYCITKFSTTTVPALIVITPFTVLAEAAAVYSQFLPPTRVKETS